MPEAAIHHDDGSESAYHDVRLAWKALDVQTISETMRIEILPNPQFGLGILRTDVTHALVPLGGS